MFNIIVDGLEIIINFISLSVIAAFLQIINFALDVAINFVSTLYLFIFFGRRGTAMRSTIKKVLPYLIGQVIEFIPGLDSLPLRTLTFAAALILNYIDLKREENKKYEEEKKKEQGQY